MICIFHIMAVMNYPFVAPFCANLTHLRNVQYLSVYISILSNEIPHSKTSYASSTLKKQLFSNTGQNHFIF